MVLLPYLNPYILGSMIITILFLVFLYILNYQLPAISLQFKTQRINNALKAFAKRPVGSVLPHELDELFQDRPFLFLWNEFKNSLHEMSSEEGDQKSVRSTLTADFYFSKEAIVDGYINVEFFKHLPGILTGVGIIGTFSGLIWGLRQFNTTNAVETLNLLLGEVSSAFVGSGVAIFVAIFITFFEKQTLNRCYKLLEETGKLLDSLYKAGVGEDYLARLVKATETSARNSVDFKQVLIDNLEVMMEKQSVVIGKTIANSLESPIDKLLVIVNQASGDQSDVIKNLVESLMNTFIAKIDQAFGTQIEAVNQAIYRSSTTMESVEDSMRRLLNDIAAASQNAVKSMSEQMLETVIQANINQDQKNESLRKVIDELHQLSHAHQTQSNAMIEEVMTKVLESFGQSLVHVHQAREQQNQQDENRNSLLLSSAKEFHSGLQTLFKESMGEQHALNLKLKDFVQEVQQLSLDHQVQSKEVIQGVLDRLLQSVAQSMEQMSTQRVQQSLQDQEYQAQFIASANQFFNHLQEVLKASQNDQFELNLKLKTFVEELNQMTFDYHLKSREVIDQSLVHIQESIDTSMSQLAQARVDQNTQDENRNQRLMLSMDEFQTGTQSLLQNAQQEQFGLNLKLKTFVEELNQLTYDLQLKSKDVIDQTLDKVLLSVDHSMQKIAQAQESQGLANDARNAQIVSSTQELYQGMTGILNQSMQDQFQLNLKLKDFVAELNQMSVTHLQQSKDLMQNSTIEVLEKLTNGMNVIASDRRQQMESDEDRANALTRSTNVLHDKIAEQVKNLVDEFNRASAQSQSHILAIEKFSIHAIEKMGDGATRMNAAADQFSSSGNVIIGAFEQSKTITQQMETIGGRMQNMLTNIHDLFKQFEQSSYAHQEYLKELTQLITSAKQESGISAQIVKEMETSLRTLQQAEATSNQYLNNVNQVLKDAFGQFNTQMMAQVTSLNQENDRLLGSAITALTGAVEQMVRTTSKLAQN